MNVTLLVFESQAEHRSGTARALTDCCVQPVILDLQDSSLAERIMFWKDFAVIIFTAQECE